MLMRRSAPNTRVSPAPTRKRMAAPDRPDTETTRKVSGVTSRSAAAADGLDLCSAQKDVASRLGHRVGEGVEADGGVLLQCPLVLRAADLVVDGSNRQH